MMSDSRLRASIEIRRLGVLMVAVSCLAVGAARADVKTQPRRAFPGELSRSPSLPSPMVQDAAGATPFGRTVTSGGTSRSFEIQANHDYRAAVYAVGHAVLLEVRNQAARVEYTAPNLGRGNHVKARFGQLGVLNMRFVPAETPKRTTSDPGCHGRAGFVQRGRFLGVLRWHGERGFSSVDVHSADGRYQKTFRAVCQTRRSSERPLILAEAETPSDRTTTVEAWTVAQRLELTAAVQESEGPMTVSRHLLGGGAIALVHSERGGRIALSPPAPFSGLAEFVPEAGRSGSWLGSLSGQFPGIGSVSLAGPAFRALRPTP